LIFHEALKGMFAPPKVHYTHDQDETDEDSADKGHRQGLEKGSVVTRVGMLPDDLSFRAHTMSPLLNRNFDIIVDYQA
jgi:hypothetical protein